MLDYFVTDVFTDRPFTGNPLAIVTGADDLTTLQMQTLARQFNLSETIFVQTPDNPDHAAKVRIFFPTDEIPFAGHPTIGCAIHLATAAHTGDFESQLVLEEVAGLVPVTVSRRDSVTRAELTAPILPEPTGGHVERDLIATAINLAPEDFDRDTAAVHAGGPAFLYIEVASPDALRRAAPHEPAWQHLTETAGVDAAYLYTPTRSGYRARMFSPRAGIPEDPATGSASAIFASQLLATGRIGEGTTDLLLEQGVEMGRPSRIELSADVAGGALRQVRVAGSAVPVAKGRIVVPPA